MGFLPTNTILGPVDEEEQFSFTITYESTDPITGTTSSSSVEVIELDEDPGVEVINDNNITGAYVDAFDQQLIKYRNKDDTFTNVQKWGEIDTQRLYGVYHFIQDPRMYRDFRFLASAGGNSQEYVVRLNNNLDYDKRQLAKYVNPAGIVVTWTNTGGNTITWVDSNNNEITWTT